MRDGAAGGSRQRLDNLASKRVMRDQLAYVQDKRMELAHLQQRLGDLSGALLSRRRQRFSALAAALDAMSPLKVLGRATPWPGPRTVRF